jgi:hypothetical protein
VRREGSQENFSADGVTQVVECLLNKHEALISNSNTIKKKEEERKKRKVKVKFL